MQGSCFEVVGKLTRCTRAWLAYVQTAKAFSSVLDLKGHGGIRPCIRCQNVLKKGSNLVHRRPNFVDITCADSSRFQLSEPADLVHEVRQVLDAYTQQQNGLITTARLGSIEKAYGINANVRGLLADVLLHARFSIIDVLNEDWMHGALQEGTLTMACRSLLTAAHDKIGLPQKSLTTLLKADFRFPAYCRQKMRAVWKVSASMNDNFNVKCPASVLLGFYVLLRHFVRTIVATAVSEAAVDFSKESGAFHAQCKVVDLIMMLKS